MEYFVTVQKGQQVAGKPWRHGSHKDGSTRSAWTLKQSPAQEPPCPPPPAFTFPLSPVLSFLSLLSRKVVAPFHSWVRAEQYSTPLPWIRIRNPIRPSYSSYSFFFFFHTVSDREEGGLKEADVKANSCVLHSFFPFVTPLLLLCLYK